MPFLRNSDTTRLNADVILLIFGFSRRIRSGRCRADPKDREERKAMKQNNHLPMYGVGPIYVAIIIGLTLLGIILSRQNVIPVIRGQEISVVMLILGIGLVIWGIYLWYAAVIRDKIDEGIVHNRLVTTGIYAQVRNPIYSAFFIACTGVLLIYGNVCLLVLPVVYWILLTILMKRTEERWLHQLYGKAYEDYCRRVNRCIPWREKR